MLTFNKIINFLGIEFHIVSLMERLISVVGGFLGIGLVLWTSHYFLGTQEIPLIVASMGASAVLLFAVPHGALSQPWSLVMGHLVSAIIGVTCAKWVPHWFLAAPLTVGLAIGAMQYLRCIHPPAAATGLTAVIGGTSIQNLGYQYVITPVLLNAMVLLVAAIVVNYLFPWRRYPASLKPKVPKEAPTVEESVALSHNDLEYALRQLDSFIDVTEEDLTQIYALAVQHSHCGQMAPLQVQIGYYYSNGEYGESWSIRRVVDILASTEGHSKDRVAYQVVAGQGRRNLGDCSREDLTNWAKYEVVRDENSWKMV